MKSLKKANIPLIVAVGIALVLFIIGSFYDKSISESLYNKYQLNIPWFSLGFVLLGPLVTNAFGAFAGSALFLAKPNKTGWFYVLLKCFGIFAICGVSFFAYTSGNELSDVIPGISEKAALITNIVILITILAIDAAVFTLVYINRKKFDQENLFWVALTMVLIIAITSGLGEVIKYLASRPRPRIVFPGLEEYRDWWQWKPLYGLKVSESKSFISGHSSNGASITFLLPLFLSVTKLGEKKYTVLVAPIIGILYAFVVALSRLFAIAHYASDIAGGLIFSLIIGSVISRVMILIQKKTEDKSPASN